MTTLHPIPRHWRSTWPVTPQLRLRPEPQHDLAPLRAALPARAATPQAPLAAAILLSLAVGVVATLPEFAAVDRGWWQARFLAPASVGGLVAWLLAAHRPPLATQILVLATAVACTALLVWLPAPAADTPDAITGISDPVALALRHVPLVLLGAAGAAFVGGAWRTTAARLGFLRFLGEVVVLGAALVVGGCVVGMLTVLLYSALGVELFDGFLRWVVLPGVCMAPVLAAGVGARLGGRGEELARTLVRVFAAPLLLVAATWPLAVVGGHGPGDREVLRQLHGLLPVVVAMAALAIALRPHDASLARDDAVAAGLVLTALVLVLLALGGLLPRIAAGGLTPNRAAALGADLLLLVHLGAVLRSYVRARRTGGGIATVQAALAGWLPVYVAWAAVVAVTGFAAG